MAKIKPTLSITANSNTHATVADRGPVSSAIELQTFVDVSVDDMRVDELVATTTRAKLTIPDHDTGGATKTPGSVGCFLFIRNSETTGSDRIHVGLVMPAHSSNNPAVPAEDGNTSSLDGTTQESLRSFSLLKGEFAFFPWDYIGDIYVETASGNQNFEVIQFNRG